MKKVLLVLSTILLIVNISFVVYAEAEVEAVVGVTAEMVRGSLLEETVRVVVNGQELVFPDVQPYLDANGRTQ